MLGTLTKLSHQVFQVNECLLIDQLTPVKLLLQLTTDLVLVLFLLLFVAFQLEFNSHVVFRLASAFRADGLSLIVGVVTHDRALLRAWLDIISFVLRYFAEVVG